MEKHSILFHVKNIILIIFIGILITLSILSALYTCSIHGSDWVKYRADHPLGHITLFVAISAFTGVGLYTIRKHKSERTKPDNTKHVLLIVFFAFFLLLLLWVFTTQEKPRADMEICLTVAKQIRNGDYTAFQPGVYVYLPPYQGYMFSYPFQIGFVLLCALISAVCGSANFLMFQCINAICVVLTVFYLYQISCLNQESKATRFATVLFLIAFLPISLYVTMVYGNLIGLLLAVIAFYKQLRYFKDRRLGFAVVSIVCVAMAALVKPNELIMMTAMGALYFLDLIEHKNLKSAILLISMITVYFLVKVFLIAAFEAATGVSISQGVPMVAYIAMGLQNSGCAPGWYNKYTLDIFFQSGMNSAAAAQEAMQSIRSSIQEFSSNLPNLAQFLARKIASQWADSSFQCFWMYESNSALDSLSPFIESISNGAIAKGLHDGFLNYLQTFIYLGTCCYTALYWKRIRLQELLIPICFIGGFLFSLIWEAQSQYTMPFFFLLIPLAAKGIVELANRVADAIEKKKSSSIERKTNI